MILLIGPLPLVTSWWMASASLFPRARSAPCSCSWSLFVFLFSLTLIAMSIPYQDPAVRFLQGHHVVDVRIPDDGDHRQREICADLVGDVLWSNGTHRWGVCVTGCDSIHWESFWCLTRMSRLTGGQVHCDVMNEGGFFMGIVPEPHNANAWQEAWTVG